MLQPNGKIKYRRVQRGRMKGKALRGNKITNGEFGLVATEPSWITSNQLFARFCSEFCCLHSLTLHFIFKLFFGCETALDRELMHSKTHSFACNIFSNAAHFEHYSARLNNGYPIFGRTFTGTHSSFSRLFSDRLVGEYLDPNLTATTDVTSHRYTGCFDLVGCDP